MRLCVLAASVVLAAGCNRSDPPSPPSAAVTGQARVDPGVVQRTPATATPATATPATATPATAAPATASAPAAPSGSASVAAPAAPTPGTVDVAAPGGALPVIHGDKWHDAEEE